MRSSLSLITPVFNEPEIHLYLPIIDRELANTGLPYEIIAVNDGSDAVTTTRLNSLKLSSLRSFTYAKNQGKGYALAYGFKIAKGNIICFMDADLQLHPQQIALFTNLMALLNADMVIGSKRHPLSQVEYGPHRRLYSWGYQQLVRLMFNLNVTDTQVGLKLFRRYVLEKVIPKLVVKRWAFDLELLAIATHLGFNRIVEAPIHLNWKPGKSNVNWKAIPRMLQDTMAIFYRKNVLNYYDRKTQRQDQTEVPVISHHLSHELQQPIPKTQPKSTLTTSGVIFSKE
jgi:glycosyltransferase involved in cell wall biosynthesis